jgi:DNA-binding NtrC family response regulator
VAREDFRQDLFYRLNVVPIIVPPLREHAEDIPVLADQFCRRFARKHGVNVHGLSEAANRALVAHPWPGNVRELQNVLERAVILCGDSTLLEPQHLGLGRDTLMSRPVAAPTTSMAATAASGPAAAPEAGPITLAELEKRHILATIERLGHNRTQAARALDISVRTLRNKLTEYGWKDQEEGEEPTNAVA